MSIETRSNSALLKRAEQLKRWQESDTCRRCGDTRRGYKPKVQFTDGCVFLAACAASDKEEVRRLLARGADIDTANVDGLTALHQACIDDNLEMVEFLVERGADVNRGDNEGWTPLHATASCGFLSIAKYLLEHKCNVAAVNNDGELAIDISESDEMEELLQTEISSRSIDCEASRIVEERLMFEDAKKWVETDKFGDIPHQKTGATSLHVASAKGYIKVIGLLLECQAPISIQDYDGWTPLHAAAHWAQREAIELLCKNMADMDIKNYVGQTCFDVADPDVLKLLESLKREQATIQKEKPDIRNLVNRPSISSGGGKRSLNSSSTPSIIINNNNIVNNSNNRNLKIIADDNNSDRSSITRLSIDDKELRSKKDSSYERDSLRGSSLVSETIQESNKFNADSDVGRKNRANLSDVPKITLSKDESSSNKVPGYSPPHPPEDNKKKIASSPVETSPDEVHPWRRPLSLRSRPVSSSSTSSSSAVNNNNNKLQKDDNSSDSDVPLRRIHSFESDEKFYSRLTELREKIRSHHSNSSSGVETTPPPSSRSNSSSRYLNPSSSSPSGGGGRSGNFSSLPRSHKPLPSLPEHSKTPSPSTPTNGTAAACGSLFRSASLRDNSTPFRRPPDSSESSSQINLNTLNNNNSSSSSSSPNNRTQFNNNDNNNNNNNDNNNINNNNNYDNNHNRRPCRLSSARTESGEFSPSDFYSPRPSSLLLGRNIWKRYDPDGANRVNKSDSLGSNSLAKGHQPPQSHVRSGGVHDENSLSKEDEEQQPTDKASLGSVFKNFFKSFVPPVRDEESETQRKAHAKRVRETRRSTQGVTLEDLKSAEQLVKKKQQQENQIRTSELQQLAAAGVGSTATTTVTTSATLVAASGGGLSPASTTSSSTSSSSYERKPSWRIKTAEASSDKNKFRLEDAGPSETLNALRKSSKMEGKGPPPLPASEPPSLLSPTASSRSNEASLLNNSGTQQVIQRRKKPKRRSTGVVHLDLGDLDKEDEEGDEESEESDEQPQHHQLHHQPSLTLASLEREVNGLKVAAAEEDEKLIVLRKDDLNSLLTSKPTLLIGKELNLSGDAAGKGSSSSSKYLHPNNAQHQAGGYHNKSGGDKETHNGGEMDYKKLWEESQLENSRLREELSRSEDTRGRLEGALDSASKPQPISEAEKREKRALEKKLSEMEEELKQIEHLKNEIQRLRDENGALIRVISKLSK